MCCILFFMLLESKFQQQNGLISCVLLGFILLETQTMCGNLPPSNINNNHIDNEESSSSQPYFENTTQREITTTIGQIAFLHCRVKNLNDKAVSWIRKRDLHILTVGIQTYTNDQRFQSIHTEGSDEWTLRILSPQPRDTGTYECQISTEPKISQAFRLNVIVSQAKILGNSELFIKSGSSLNLTCLTIESPDPPSFIFWYKDKRVMNYLQRDGIHVITEPQARTSKLLIKKATPLDSGNYTCSPSSSDSASVMVHIINDEHQAAMQHGNSSANSIKTTSLLFYMGATTATTTNMISGPITTTVTTATTIITNPVQFIMALIRSHWSLLGICTLFTSILIR